MRQKSDPEKHTANDFAIVTTEFDRNNGITGHLHKQATLTTAGQSGPALAIHALTRNTNGRATRLPLAVAPRIQSRIGWTITQGLFTRNRDQLPHSPAVSL
jgi:hypothetical protein